VKYLVDSDWLIDAFGGVASAIQTLALLRQDTPAVSIVSYGELFDGGVAMPDPEQRIAQLAEFLDEFELLGLDPSTMRIFAQVRNQLRHRGQIIPDFDILIASTALQHDLTLLTRNIRHFSRIPNLRLYLPR
jgi:tRNA(fMet)-specific endonuclease VapC